MLIKVGEVHDLVIATIAFPDKSSETNALLLVDSIRCFAGNFSDVPIWCYVPETGRTLSSETIERLHDLNARVITFRMDQDVLRFPFMGHVHAAALAEVSAEKKTELLGWLSPNTLVLQEPANFILDDGITLGYRPVHHKLLGMTYEEPLDPFWTEIYRVCKVPGHRVFEMRTQVEDMAIRPYFNGGSLVVRPKRKIFQTWRDCFLNEYQQKVFQDYYQHDGRYSIFVHQAILSGIILQTLEIDEMYELPPRYNYPLNLYAEDITSNRPSTIEECVTVRHEGFYSDPDWRDKIPANDDLKDWIAARLH